MKAVLSSPSRHPAAVLGRRPQPPSPSEAPWSAPPRWWAHAKLAALALCVMLALSQPPVRAALGGAWVGVAGPRPASEAGPPPPVAAAARPTPLADASALPSPPVPLLTTLELLTLQTHVRGARLYVEWGSGASTSLVAPLARAAVSIDNNAEWCARVAGRSDVAWWVANGALSLVCVDTGPTGDFGAPAAGADPASFPAYSAAIDAAVDAYVAAGRHRRGPRRALAGAHASSYPVDAVLVDGRFRVACALRALRHVRAGHGVVMVHDWERAAYRDALAPFYDVVEVAGRLGVLTAKRVRGVEWGEWAAALGRWEKDPA